MVVLDELDGLKRKVQGKEPKQHLRYTAQEFARRFDEPRRRSTLIEAETTKAETTV